MLRVSKDVEIDRIRGVSCVRGVSSLTKSDEKELHFWKTDPLEYPQGDLFDNIVSKARFINVFNRLMPLLGLEGKETVLEMGGGHCWASSLVKRSYPDCYVVASDLSPDAVRFVEKYEDILQVSVDEKWAYNCRQIPFEGEQFDVIFTFAAFHHFGENNDFSAAIREMVRVLRLTGKIVLLYEPSSPKWAYRLVHRRMNRQRISFSHNVDEDVLIVSKIRQACERIGCRLKVQYSSSFEERSGIVETVYFYTLTRLKPLRRVLPCGVNLVIEKL